MEAEEKYARNIYSSGKRGTITPLREPWIIKQRRASRRLFSRRRIRHDSGRVSIVQSAPPKKSDGIDYLIRIYNIDNTLGGVPAAKSIQRGELWKPASRNDQRLIGVYGFNKIAIESHEKWSRASRMRWTENIICARRRTKKVRAGSGRSRGFLFGSIPCGAYRISSYRSIHYNHVHTSRVAAHRAIEFVWKIWLIRAALSHSSWLGMYGSRKRRNLHHPRGRRERTDERMIPESELIASSFRKSIIKRNASREQILIIVRNLESLSNGWEGVCKRVGPNASATGQQSVALSMLHDGQFIIQRNWFQTTIRAN